MKHDAVVESSIAWQLRQDAHRNRHWRRQGQHSGITKPHQCDVLPSSEHSHLPSSLFHLTTSSLFHLTTSSLFHLTLGLILWYVPLQMDLAALTFTATLKSAVFVPSSRFAVSALRSRPTPFLLVYAGTLHTIKFDSSSWAWPLRSQSAMPLLISSVVPSSRVVHALMHYCCRVLYSFCLQVKLQPKCTVIRNLLERC